MRTRFPQHPTPVVCVAAAHPRKCILNNQEVVQQHPAHFTEYIWQRHICLPIMLSPVVAESHLPPPHNLRIHPVLPTVIALPTYDGTSGRTCTRTPVFVLVVKGCQPAFGSGLSGRPAVFFEGGAFRQIRQDVASARMRRGRAYAVPTSAEGSGAPRTALCRAGWGQGQSQFRFTCRGNKCKNVVM